MSSNGKNPLLSVRFSQSAYGKGGMPDPKARHPPSFIFRTGTGNPVTYRVDPWLRIRGYVIRDLPYGNRLGLRPGTGKTRYLLSGFPRAPTKKGGMPAPKGEHPPHSQVCLLLLDSARNHEVTLHPCPDNRTLCSKQSAPPLRGLRGSASYLRTR
jgi:hypothetical protein